MKKTILFLLCAVCAFSSVAVAAEMNLALFFDPQINSESFTQGEPVIAVVVASNPEAMMAHNYNTVYGGKAKKIKPVSLGSMFVPWTSLIRFSVVGPDGKDAQIKFTPAPSGERAMVLDERSAAKGFFFLKPEDTAGIKAGKYTIKAMKDSLTSEPLIMEIRVKAGSSAKARQIESLVRFGRYYLLTADYGKTRELADKILGLESYSLDGMNLLGDALAGQKKYGEATQVFDKAIKEYFAQQNKSGTPANKIEPPLEFINKRNKFKQLAR